MTTREIDSRTYCPQCEASLTETDLECGYCTQCGAEIGTEDEDEKNSKRSAPPKRRER